MNYFLMQVPATRALVVYGDAELAGAWMRKALHVYEGTDIRTDPALFPGGYYGTLITRMLYLPAQEQL